MIGARADRPDLRVLSLGAGVQSSCIDEHTIRPFLDACDLHPAKAKQINAVQTPTPNAERHSARAT